MSERSLKPGWSWVKFGDVVRLSKDRAANPEAEGIERYVGLEHIDPDDLQIRRWGLVAEGITFTSRFKAGQVLFGKRRAYQRKVAVADFEGVCSGDIYVFESANPKVLLPELLPFICQTDRFFDHAVGTSAGSLSPRTNWTSLANFEFALPPLEEQKHLCKIFNASNILVEKLRFVEASASKCLVALREDFFSLKSCTVTELQDLLSNVEAGRSFLGTESTVSPGQFGVLKVSAVGSDEFRPSEAKTLVDQNSFLEKFSIKAGDLLITRANTPDLVGMSCFVETNYQNLMLSDKVLRLVPKKGISNRLLLESLWTSRVRQQLRSVATGTGAAMKNISQEKLSKLILAFPKPNVDTKAFITNIQQLRSARNSARQKRQLAEKRHVMILSIALEGYQ